MYVAMWWTIPGTNSCPKKAFYCIAEEKSGPTGVFTNAAWRAHEKILIHISSPVLFSHLIQRRKQFFRRIFNWKINI